MSPPFVASKELVAARGFCGFCGDELDDTRSEETGECEACESAHRVHGYPDCFDARKGVWIYA